MYITSIKPKKELSKGSFQKNMRKVFEMMRIMLDFAPNECQSCGSMNFEKEIIVPDRDWIKPILVNDRAFKQKLC